MEVKFSQATLRVVKSCLSGFHKPNMPLNLVYPVFNATVMMVFINYGVATPVKVTPLFM